MSKNEIWKLREEVSIFSLMGYCDYYNNSFNFDAPGVMFFFRGYEEYIEEIACRKREKACVCLDEILKYDNPENLYKWYLLFEKDENEWYPFEKLKGGFAN